MQDREGKLMDKKKKISTSALSKKLSLSSKDLFTRFEKRGWITGTGKGAELTDLGKKKGGEYTVSDKFGKYIVWPSEVFISDVDNPALKHTIENYFSATKLGEKLGMGSRKMNAMLSELGWIDKQLKGWVITKQGLKLGGVQKEIKKTGEVYAVWPDSILKNKAFTSTLTELKGETATVAIFSDTQEEKEDNTFREKFPATFRTTDGHMVRSKAEAIIDNWLYMAEIVHAYERRLPVEEELYCDFYIPSGRVYIEYWGYENKKAYLARKDKKIAIYKQYDFNLIELNDNDVANLDDVLPKKLLQFDVKAY